MRLFAAIPIPRDLQTRLSSVHQSFHYPDIRWVQPENYHITVSFFGEVGEEYLGDVQTQLKRIATATESFTLDFDSLQFAPPKKTPSMIWATYHSNQQFRSLVERIEKAVQPIYPFVDQRDGHHPIPHITLARFKLLPETVLPTIGLLAFPVTEIALYESLRTPHGPLYTGRAVFPLA